MKISNSVFTNSETVIYSEPVYNEKISGFIRLGSMAVLYIDDSKFFNGRGSYGGAIYAGLYSRIRA